jgi:hypothetical protein
MAVERARRLYSYVVLRDFGFAPNPFNDVCTLATCKADIRRTALVDDWILGTGSKSRGLGGRVVYAMRVTQKLTYDEYWEDPRFSIRRPRSNGSLKQAFGDNIYHRDEAGDWVMERSHHSLYDGTPNPKNLCTDTRGDAVLVSDDFLYWGGGGPAVPSRFRSFNGVDVCVGRGYAWRPFEPMLVRALVAWLTAFDERGYLGVPEAWTSGRAYRRGAGLP